jgi:hypothetical protein
MGRLVAELSKVVASQEILKSLMEGFLTQTNILKPEGDLILDRGSEELVIGVL